MAAAVISTIFKLISAGSTALELYNIHGARAQAAAEAARLLAQSNNVRLFATQDFALIERIHHDFHNTYLRVFSAPSLVLTQAQLLPGGHLRAHYERMQAESRSLWGALWALDWLTTNNSLHVDDYNFFGRMVYRGYVQLFHIEALALHLRAIELLDTLDYEHPHLYPTTLDLKAYVLKAQMQLVVLYDKTVAARAPYVGSIRSRTTGNVVINTYWYFRDSYSPLSSTPADQRIGQSGEHRFHRSRSQAEQGRNAYFDELRRNYDVLTGSLIIELRTQLDGFVDVVNDRLEKQRARGGKDLRRTKEEIRAIEEFVAPEIKCGWSKDVGEDVLTDHEVVPLEEVQEEEEEKEDPAV